VKYLALAYSTVAVLIFLYGGYLVILTSPLFPANVIGAILLVPAVAWWLVGLIHLATQRRWGWLVGYILLLMLAPMIYDMYQVRAATAASK
jgi:hypothetical protein